MKRKRSMAAMILSGLMVLCLLWMCCGGDVRAADKRVVRVAFFPMDGYHIVRPDGSLDGMDVAYLAALCEYVEWEIEYVECDSWEQALQLLKEEKVDLVGSAQYSAERAEQYEYADLASGYTFGVIATDRESSVAYEDFIAMEGITFGMVRNYVREKEFFQYLADNGITNPRVIRFESTEKLQQALHNGKIDALVHTFTEIQEGQRLVGRFAPRPFYYISYQGNADVMRELNQAVADLKMNQPELEAELMNAYYYSRFDKAALLSTVEKKYLAETELLRVGYLDGYYPFSYAEDGEFKGLSREMLESGLSMTGQRLEYVEFRDKQNARVALQRGDIDILLYCTDSDDILSSYDLTAVREYASVPLVLVMDRKSNAAQVGTVATVSYLEDAAKAAIMQQGVTVRICDTQQECLTEVKKGRADATVCDGYLVEHLFRTDFQYEDLQIKNIFSTGYPICVAVRAQDRLLSKILSKTTAAITFQTINEYMLKENSYPLVSVRNFIQDHSELIIVLLLVVVVVVVLVARHIINDEKKIRRLMYKDTSIDIWNLNYLIYWGEHKLLPERKGGYAIVNLNVSQFRNYNVIYGWNSGERLLEGIAGFLKGNVKEDTEICSRNQSDRFVLLLNYTEEGAFRKRLHSLKARLENLIYNLTENHMNVLMGVYFIKPQEKDLQVAFNYAGQALESAKGKGKDTVKVYDEELVEETRERHEREKLLESVNVNRDFTVYYQPKVDIRSGRIVGAEALVRFLNPAEGGAVKSPGFFVPYYEQSGKITQIDFFVYESVCRMLRRRLDAGENVVPISCNFSRLHFIRPDFAEKFLEILERYRIPKELIEVEITETIVIEELQRNTIMQTLNDLFRKGIRLSIDDFGSGYSSLGVLEQIPASVIKLDRSFLLNKEDRERQIAIMRGIVNMARDLDARIVCEGVETDSDIQLMEEIGAYVAQGYRYFKPIPERLFEEKLGE